MQFQVTDIHFDFGDSFEPIITNEEMDEIVDETFLQFGKQQTKKILWKKLLLPQDSALTLLITSTF